MKVGAGSIDLCPQEFIVMRLTFLQCFKNRSRQPPGIGPRQERRLKLRCCAAGRKKDIGLPGRGLEKGQKLLKVPLLSRYEIYTGEVPVRSQPDAIHSGASGGGRTLECLPPQVVH
jgi:hypothetical protein